VSWHPPAHLLAARQRQRVAKSAHRLSRHGVDDLELAEGAFARRHAGEIGAREAAKQEQDPHAHDHFTSPSGVYSPTVLYAVFLVSGFCGLLYEVVFAKSLALA